jgi:chemotaxis receptor (MCP) glutamine deamidase CheD/CheY-like chemotaxis protein
VEVFMQDDVVAPTGMERVFLLPGELCVAREPLFLATLLGSCVSVCLNNRKTGTAAMNHFVRDRRVDSQEPCGKFGDTSTTYLIESLLRDDASPGHYEARVFGGGAVVGHLGVGMGIGQHNIDVALETLERFKIPVVARDVGGKNGRKIYFNTKTASVDVRPIRMRHKDFEGRKVRVLIVDDSEVVRRILRKDIEGSAEFEVCGEASDAYGARDLILELDPDVISLDIIMPKLDGLDFLEKLMRFRPKPVVIVSTIAKTGSPIALRAKSLGACCVIDKEELSLYQGPGYARNQYLAALKTASSGSIWTREC